jgi:hypothetical protein
MNTATNTFSGFALDKLQTYFESDFSELERADEDALEYITQCHFGDMLIENAEPREGERFKLWRKLDCNGGGIQVEYCGAANDYRWETVYES